MQHLFHRRRQLSRIAVADLKQGQSLSFFCFNDTATTEIYTLSLHDALPIYDRLHDSNAHAPCSSHRNRTDGKVVDRKSTRLNSSHVKISYAVFCLKKKN